MAHTQTYEVIVTWPHTHNRKTEYYYFDDAESARTRFAEICARERRLSSLTGDARCATAPHGGECLAGVASGANLVCLAREGVVVAFDRPDLRAPGGAPEGQPAPTGWGFV